MSVRFLATGSALPDFVLSNTDLEQLVDTSDEWIYTRTGIKERHVSRTETVTSLMHAAALKALEQAQLDPNRLDLIVCATIAPDASVPSTAAQVSRLLGVESCAAFDVNASCSGFLYAATAAQSLMESMGWDYALVIGGDVLSRLADWSDRSTCVLFGDGAGAAVLARGEGEDKGAILAGDLRGFSDFERVLTCDYPANDSPFYQGPPVEDTKMRMNGRKVFMFSVNAIGETLGELFRKAGVDKDQVRWIVPHQANQRIIASAAQRADIPLEKFYLTLEHTANTSGASVPIALDFLNRSGQLERGDLIALVAFGGGLTSGGMLVRW